MTELYRLPALGAEAGIFFHRGPAVAACTRRGGLAACGAETRAGPYRRSAGLAARGLKLRGSR